MVSLRSFEVSIAIVSEEMHVVFLGLPFYSCMQGIHQNLMVLSSASGTESKKLFTRKKANDWLAIYFSF